MNSKLNSKSLVNAMQQASLWQPGQKVLLAVSGGLDSVVMAHLFVEAGIECSIAHCNFQLRAEESDADEQFVLEFAEQLNLACHIKCFGTESEAQKANESIQLAARRLRYAWFEELRQELAYDRIATAHHLDDNIETVIQHIVRGSGLKGLSGIPAQNGKVIRPLLAYSRQELEAYAKANNIKWREDSSNASDQYERNKIRHQLIPTLEELNPSFRDTLTANIQRWREASLVYEEAMERLLPKFAEKRGNDLYIPIKKLKKSAYASSLLYEILKPYGFSSAVIPQIIETLEEQAGRQFLSETYCLIKDRNFLILTSRQTKELDLIMVPEGSNQIETPEGLFTFQQIEAANCIITADPNTAYLDAEQLTYPLKLRRWKKGDYFYPFGLSKANGKPAKKKVSDYLIDKKLSLHEKQQLWILESDKKVAWLAGYRLDERFKRSARTRFILKVGFKPHQWC